MARGKLTKKEDKKTSKVISDIQNRKKSILKNNCKIIKYH